MCSEPACLQCLEAPCPHDFRPKPPVTKPPLLCNARHCHASTDSCRSTKSCHASYLTRPPHPAHSKSPTSDGMDDIQPPLPCNRPACSLLRSITSQPILPSSRSEASLTDDPRRCIPPHFPDALLDHPEATLVNDEYLTPGRMQNFGRPKFADALSYPQGDVKRPVTFMIK